MHETVYHQSDYVQGKNWEACGLVPTHHKIVLQKLELQNGYHTFTAMYK
jgi:hypothetical protein